jgi:putative RecB family exonuclease
MPLYSNSRLSCFEQCPLKYKLSYIENVDAKTEDTIEAFLGIRVHETLEKLYKDLKNKKENSLEELTEYYNQEWEKNWNDSIIMVKKNYTKDNYKKKGQKFISDYFIRYKPFNQEKTIGLEQRIIIELDKSGNYKLQGYIDRLAEKKDGFYEIHDYKTSANLSLQKNLDQDRQLALYAIGIYDNYSDCQDVDLVWHFLAFDKEMRSKRNKESLEKLKTETICLINTVEQTHNFPSNPSFLCEWCEYKPICREWAHLYKLESKPANIYLNDPGVKLVNTYAEIQKRKTKINDEIDNQLSQIKEAIIEFAKKENISSVFGSRHKAKVSISHKVNYPLKNDEKRQELNNIIKQNGKWNEVSELDIYALARKVNEEQWPKTLIEKIKEFQNIETIKRVYLRKIKGKEE